MIRYYYISLILILNLLSPSASGQVFLTEIMYDPLENDNANEYVEIWNGGNDPADLSGFRIGDGTSDDAIISAGNGTILGVRQFGIILDPDYFNNSVLYSGLIPDNCLVVTIDGSTIGDRGLKNSAPETVTLSGVTGAVIASYTYSIGNTPGCSDAKIEINGPDNFTNWSESAELHGSPGFYNHVSPDSLNLAAAAFSADNYNPQAGNSIELSAVIRNSGLLAFPAIETGFFKDDGDSILLPAEMFDFIRGDGLVPQAEQGCSTSTGGLWSGSHHFAVKILNTDDDSTDNISYLTINVSSEPQTVIINEIMYKPVTGQPEWVELYNPSADFIDLEDWLFADSNPEDVLVLPPAEIPPGGYAVLAEEPFPAGLIIPLEIPVLIPDSWNSLNNTGDSLRLLDQTGTVIDSLEYPDNWGGIDNGNSMERVSPASAAWFPAADISGSTPGRANSVNMAGGGVNDVSLTAFPKLFTPDGDGTDDETVITVKMPVPYAWISLRIFDVNGRLVKFLVENRNIGPEFSVTWNGNWEDGKTGRIGAYVIHLQAISEAYKKKYEVKEVVYIGGKL